FSLTKPRGVFGGSLCASSGHSSSTTSRISSEIMPICSTSSMYVLMKALSIGWHHDPVADNAGQIGAALFGHSFPPPALGEGRHRVRGRIAVDGGADPPPLKWSDLRYVFDIKEDCNGKEAIQA